MLPKQDFLSKENSLLGAVLKTGNASVEMLGMFVLVTVSLFARSSLKTEVVAEKESCS